jgi:hypothetical protein
MGFVRSIGSDINEGIDDLARGFDDKVLGGDAADAALEAGEIQATAAGQASALFNPFQGVGASGVEQAGFLTDPQAQFDFLQSNPLFQASLDNANQQTLQSAAARGRLSSGDTLQQLSQNTLLSASPLIQQQKQSIGDLLTVGQNVAGSQGNLLTGQAAASAGGIVGASNARTQGVQNLLDLGAKAAGGI